MPSGGLRPASVYHADAFSAVGYDVTYVRDSDWHGHAQSR